MLATITQDIEAPGRLVAHHIATTDRDEAQGFISTHTAPVKLETAPLGGPVWFDANYFISDEFMALETRMSGGLSLVPQVEYDTVMVRMGLSGVMRAEGSRAVERSGPDELLIYAARTGRRMLFDTDRHDLVLVLPAERVRQRVQHLIGQPIALPLDFMIPMNCDNPLGAALFSLGAAFKCGLAGSAPLMHSPIGLRRHGDALLGLMLSAIGAEKINSLAGPVSSLAAIDVARAEEYMRLNAGNAIGVSDVADALGISMRSLQYGFRKHRRTHPLAVLQRMRLEGLREDILRNPLRPIAEVAQRWGFTHLGRLSKQYQEAFGERPSVTARRGRG
ncbi:MAG: AraC family transcriptional regulator [Bosea sp. (in: a-proteobacteria)]